MLLIFRMFIIIMLTINILINAQRRVKGQSAGWKNFGAFLDFHAKSARFLGRIEVVGGVLRLDLCGCAWYNGQNSEKGAVFMRIAVVTGASSGLGREFVRELCEKAVSPKCREADKLDEIWVIARRREALEKLKREMPLPVRCLPLDLTKKESLQTLADALAAEKPSVRMLINAAGFGKIGTCRDISIQDCDDMIDLNCRAAVDVTLLSLPYMERGSRILEIASTSAFQPLPGLAVYAASKAFLMRYSRALRWELFGTGIRVTAVCPYWISDTEFIPTAQKTKNGSAVRHFPLAIHAKTVARLALFESRLGCAISTAGPVSFVHRILAKWIPHCVMIAGWEVIRRL